MDWQNPLASHLKWSSEISNRQEKEEVAGRLAAIARSGDVVGIGSGSTAFVALLALGAAARTRNLELTAIPSSAEVALACTAVGLKTASLQSCRPDWSFDGADEVDLLRNIIKGRGGAMFREKLLMRASPRTYILVDRSKLVDRLGTRFPIPIEVYPEAVHLVETALIQLDAVEITLRLAKAKDGPVITEAGNFVLDVRFREIPPGLEKEIKTLTGVIESGLFQDCNVELLVSGDTQLVSRSTEKV